MSDAPQLLGPGAQLARVRAERGPTPEDLAQTLNLSLTTLRALEADDLSRLPSPIFVRGYLRAYARQLLVPPAPVLAAFEQQLAEAGLASEGWPCRGGPPNGGSGPPFCAAYFQNPGWVMASFSALGALLLGGMVLEAGQQLDTAKEASEPLLAPVPLAPAPADAAPSRRRGWAPMVSPSCGSALKGPVWNWPMRRRAGPK